MFHSIKKAAAAATALAGLGLGGAALADAATSSSPATATQHSSRTQTPPQMPAPGTAAHENAEKTVTGAAASKAQAAAVKSAGGGTAGPVTTDYFGKGYEVVVTRSDGTKVEVHLDGSFNVMQGPPGGHGGPGAMGFRPPPVSQ
jgi:hypothetical protein